MNDTGLNALTEQWVQLLNDKSDEEALAHYCEAIVPALLPQLHEKFRVETGQEPRYDGLISLLGFTPDTVILAYRFIRPKTLVTLYTKETSKFLEQVVRHTRIPFSDFYHEPFSERPSVDVYRALEAALRRFPKGARVVVELTGGKKTMGGALAAAAGILNLDVIYIDYSEYMPQYRKPKPESTYIHLIGNLMKAPVDLFGGVELERAIEYFNIGKYDVSRALFEQASKRMANPRVAEFCSRLSEFYRLWNVFDFLSAESLAASLLEQALLFHGEIGARFHLDLSQIQNQVLTVSRLAIVDRVALLWNFFFCAERAATNNQHDIAALFYYRTIEAICDNAIQDRVAGFNRSKPDYSKFGIPADELKAQYIAATASMSRQPTDLPETLGLVDSFCLLAAVNDPLTAKYNAGRVASVARIRNQSVYAHGTTPMTADSIASIRKLATEMLAQYAHLVQLDSIENYRKHYEFIRLALKNG